MRVRAPAHARAYARARRMGGWRVNPVMPMKRAERERIHELKKEQEKQHEAPHKGHHANRGGF